MFYDEFPRLPDFPCMSSSSSSSTAALPLKDLAFSTTSTATTSLSSSSASSWAVLKPEAEDNITTESGTVAINNNFICSIMIHWKLLWERCPQQLPRRFRRPSFPIKAYIKVDNPKFR
ncbi:hypothetical protein S245_048599 [Arachis hypogaea]